LSREPKRRGRPPNPFLGAIARALGVAREHRGVKELAGLLADRSSHSDIRGAYSKSLGAGIDMARAINYIGRYKYVQRVRYGRRWGVEKEAIAKAAEKFGLDENSIFNFLHRANRRRS